MEHTHALHRHNTILKSLNKLPRKIVTIHGFDQVPAFVLHDFCQSGCFDFSKAAYFIDNPDFDCFKGVAGYDKQEQKSFCSIADIWTEPERYCSYLETSPINKKIRMMERHTLHKTGDQEKKIIFNDIAKELAFTNPDYYKWDTKHNNHGYLLFERSPEFDSEMNEHLMNGVYLLSFCPIH